MFEENMPCTSYRPSSPENHQYSEPSSPNLVVNDQYRILILIYLSATVASILMFCSEYTFYYNHICQF